MQEVAQRPSEQRSLEVDFFRMKDLNYIAEKNDLHMLCREISLTVLLVNDDVTGRIFDR